MSICVAFICFKSRDEKAHLSQHNIFMVATNFANLWHTCRPLGHITGHQISCLFVAQWRAIPRSSTWCHAHSNANSKNWSRIKQSDTKWGYGKRGSNLQGVSPQNMSLSDPEGSGFWMLMDSCGMLMDVVGAFGIRIYTYIYIYTYSHWSWDQHAMGTKHSTEQERDFTWSCLQKWGLAWRALRGCSSARSRIQVGVEYDVNETCKMIKAYLRLVMACYGIGSGVFQVSKRLVFSDTWMLECWQLRWLQDGANWWPQRSPQTGEEELCHSGMPWVTKACQICYVRDLGI